MVGQVVQGAGSATGSLHIIGVLHGPHDGRHHLGGAHNGVARGLFLGELVHHHCGFVHHHLDSKCECLRVIEME